MTRATCADPRCASIASRMPGATLSGAAVPSHQHHPGRVSTSHPAPAYGGAMATSAATPKHSDSVELKLTIPEAAQRSSVLALGMDPLAAQVRLIYFFDTPDLALERAGVVVRARRTRQGDDSVVKLRPVVPSELPAGVRNAELCKVEVDAAPGGHVCSASFKGVPKTSIPDVITGSAPI